MIHYLAIKDQNVPVRTALPATKISPVYLQQQFFLHLKQQMAQINNRRSPSPVPGVNRPASIPMRPPVSKANNLTRTTAAATIPPQHHQLPVNTRNPNELVITESSIDIFDSFSDYEAAQYRLNVIKPLLYRFLESSLQPSMPKKLSSLPEGLEYDLIAAIKKNISINQDEANSSQKAYTETLRSFKEEQEEFWNIFRELDDEFVDLSQVYNKINNQMDEDEEISYTSL